MLYKPPQMESWVLGLLLNPLWPWGCSLAYFLYRSEGTPQPALLCKVERFMECADGLKKVKSCAGRSWSRFSLVLSSGEAHVYLVCFFSLWSCHLGLNTKGGSDDDEVASTEEWRANHELRAYPGIPGWASGSVNLSCMQSYVDMPFSGGEGS